MNSRFLPRRLEWFYWCTLVVLGSTLSHAPASAAPTGTTPRGTAPGGTATASKTVASSKTVAPPLAAEEYRNRLLQVEAVLRKMEGARTRPLRSALQPLTTPQKIRRADGEVQTRSGDYWRRTGSLLRHTATQAQVREARQAVEQERQTLDDWMRLRDGVYYESADAQTIISQLEAAGEIRTGPTAFQQWMANSMKAISDAFKALVDWLSSLGPKTSKPRPLNLDKRLVTLIFYLIVASLLCLVGYLLWKALGDEVGRRGKRRKAEFDWEGEDADLLLLPPDELRLRARKYAEQNNFREALRHLYIAELLQLDAHGIWRYDNRRTNWEHIAALRQNANGANLAPPLGDLTRRFDRVRYGNADCSQEDWLRFEQDVTLLENRLPPQAAPGASADIPKTATAKPGTGRKS